MFRTSRKSLVWLVVAGCAVGAFGDAHRAVLCIAADGHVAIERSSEACCQECACETHDGSPVTEPLSLRRPERACGPCCGCIDIPVDLGGGEYDLACARGPEPIVRNKAVASLVSVAPCVAVGAPRPGFLLHSPPNSLDISQHNVCLRI